MAAFCVATAFRAALRDRCDIPRDTVTFGRDISCDTLRDKRDMRCDIIVGAHPQFMLTAHYRRRVWSCASIGRVTTTRRRAMACRLEMIATGASSPIWGPL